MRRTIVLFLLFNSAVASAQDALPASEAPPAEPMERLERMLREWQMERDSSPWRRQILERRAAEERRREFAEKANRFVALWKKLMADYSRGVVNAKDARALSKAFREVEAAGWPK